MGHLLERIPGSSNNDNAYFAAGTVAMLPVCATGCKLFDAQVHTIVDQYHDASGHAGDEDEAILCSGIRFHVSEEAHRCLLSELSVL
eukprot:SAG11_NODE_702_length_7661_cov_3.468659_2_plen_87_part_00